MAWLEITIDTTSEKINHVVTNLTARGFADLVIEDQEEFETFLEDNRAYWDYIDEDLQEKLQGLSRIKIYLEDTDQSGMKRLESAVSDWRSLLHAGFTEEEVFSALEYFDMPEKKDEVKTWYDGFVSSNERILSQKSRRKSPTALSIGLCPKLVCE